MMNEKRFRKFNPLKSRRDLFVVEGDPDAPIGMVSGGSLAGVAKEALLLAEAEGMHVKLLVPKLLYPVAESIYQDFFASVKRGLFIEQSFQGQLYRVVRMYVDLPTQVKALARSGSNPIQATEVLESLRKMVAAIQGNSNHPRLEPFQD
jgi:2-oxoglutarate ferredoxin oxidoreductase subunit alpha